MYAFSDYTNVFIDGKSDYNIAEVNERNYVKQLFHILENLLKPEFKDFNFYILFSHDPSTIPESYYFNEKNKVLFWFSEESGQMPLHCHDKYLAVFKSYIRVELSNIFANPLGFVNEFTSLSRSQISNKDIKLFFSGNLNTNRKKIYQFFLLQKYRPLNFIKILSSHFVSFAFNHLKIEDLSRNKHKWYIFFSKGFKSGFSYGRYTELLERSDFVLCPRGFQSSETFRHIEALKSGCVCISEAMPQVSIYEGHPFIIYNSEKELQAVLRKLDAGEFDLQNLRKKHFSFYESKLEISAVASRIASICKQTLESSKHKFIIN